MSMFYRASFGAIMFIVSISSASAAPLYGALAYGVDLNSDASDGGTGFTSASIDAPIYRADAALGGASYTPVLRAESVSVSPENSDDRTRGGATAYQTFTSSINQTITLDLSLHGIVTGASSYVLGDLWVIGGSSFAASDTYCSPGRYTMGIYLCGSTLGRSNLAIHEEDGDITLFDSVSFSVAAGESFAVLAELSASSFDGSADAFHTFQMSFEDDTYLTAASAAVVPVPAAVWLFVSGFVGLFAVARRKV